MPAPKSEREAWEAELKGLPAQIAAYQRHLDATPIEARNRRERLQWQITRAEKRMA